MIKVQTIEAEKPSYGEWALYIAQQARSREGVEGVRVKRNYD